MRPVNLIPPEERRGDRAPLRRGSLSYVVVGGLAAALIGVTMVVMTNNTIADREAEIATLEVREDDAQARAERLAAFAEFSNVSTARTATVSSLARSRFDWYRVLQELSLVIPEDVALSSLRGSVTPEVGVGEDSSLRIGSQGPALSMRGCAESHDAVAGLLQDLRDIDGVTRVGLTNSSITEASGSGGGGRGGSNDAGCLEGASLIDFGVIAVFDEVILDPAAAATTPAPVAPTGTPASATTTPTDPAVDDGRAQEQQGRDSIESQSEKAREATNLIPGVAR